MRFDVNDDVDVCEKVSTQWLQITGSKSASRSVEHLTRGRKIGVKAVGSVEHFVRGQNRATRICRTF